MRSLAESIGVSQASATGIVDRMEQRGLVERRREDDDRRVIRVQLAPEGRALLASVSADRRQQARLPARASFPTTSSTVSSAAHGPSVRARDRYLERVAAPATIPTPATDEATR